MGQETKGQEAKKGMDVQAEVQAEVQTKVQTKVQ